MFNKELLQEIAHIILKRGVQVDLGGIEHKHNEEVALPRSPIKLHLCTRDLRPQGNLTRDDMQKIAVAMYGYIKHKKLDVRALGCVPRVGLRYARLLQDYARKAEGRYWPIVLAHKIDKTDGKREIGSVTPSEEYPSGPLWLIDDLINWGRSKAEAHRRYEEAGYRVAGTLVAVDYGVGGRMVCERLGSSLHELLSVESLLEYARDAQPRLLDHNVIHATQQYLTASRVHLARVA